MHNTEKLFRQVEHLIKPMVKIVQIGKKMMYHVYFTFDYSELPRPIDVFKHNEPEFVEGASEPPYLCVHVFGPHPKKIMKKVARILIDPRQRLYDGGYVYGQTIKATKHLAVIANLTRVWNYSHVEFPNTHHSSLKNIPIYKVYKAKLADNPHILCWPER